MPVRVRPPVKSRRSARRRSLRVEPCVTVSRVVTSRFWLIAVLLSIAACQSGAALGTTCSLSSECASPLVCRIGRCRTQCAIARDCPAGQVCLITPSGLGACELPAIDVCSVSCDPPLACASGHCRVRCTTNDDCPGGHVCTANACQRADAMLDAGLEAGTDASLDSGLPPFDAGLTCDPVANTGCAGRCGLVSGAPTCVPGGGVGALEDACTSESTCGPGLSCQGGRCVRVCFLAQAGFCAHDLTCSGDSVHGQVPLASGSGLGLCSEACDPVADQGCPVMVSSCAIGTDRTGHDFTWCRDVGASAIDGSCSNAYDCAAGLTCYMGTCHKMCDFSTTAGCPSGHHCGSIQLTSFLDRRPNVGVCLP